VSNAKKGRKSFKLTRASALAETLVFQQSGFLKQALAIGEPKSKKVPQLDDNDGKFFSFYSTVTASESGAGL
jgi:hypothetical protein